MPTACIILLRKSEEFFVCGCTVVFVRVVLPMVTGTFDVFVVAVIAFEMVFNSGGEVDVTIVVASAVAVVGNFFGDTSLI